MSTAEQYAIDVLSGKVVAGRLVKLAAQRFLDDLKRTDIRFDEDEANKFVYFAERYCNLSEDEWQGKPVKIMPWMAFIFQQIFGWIRVKDGKRRVRKVYVQIAKKNAKSTLAAILNAFHLYADDKIKTPKIFVGANNEDQAKICVNITGKTIEHSPALYEYVESGVVKIFRYKDNIINILHSDRDGFIKALSKEPAQKTDSASGGKHGINPSLGVIDEYGMADTASLYSTLETAQAARSEPLMFTITTAGYKMNGPAYAQLRKTGIEVLDGIIDGDSFLPFIYEHDAADKEKGIPADDPLTDPSCWIKSNPNLGVSVQEEFLKDQVETALREGASKRVDVLTLNFNQWCEAAEVWIPMETWAKNTHGIAMSDLIGKPCYTGYDFSGRIDICAAAAFFPAVKKINGKDIHAVLVWFWMPEVRVTNNKEQFDYTEWVEAGLIQTIPGDTIEWEYISAKMESELPKYLHQSGAYDPYIATNGAIQLLSKQGLELNPISQGFATISEPTKEWETMLTAGVIEHFNNPVLAWMNKNTSIIRDNNRNMKIRKIDGEKGNLKIDGIAACINALAQYKSAPPVEAPLIERW